jgi:hypothetical protein
LKKERKERKNREGKRKEITMEKGITSMRMNSWWYVGLEKLGHDKWLV